jgi:osmotically-inducible protein OsmY
MLAFGMTLKAPIEATNFKPGENIMKIVHSIALMGIAGAILSTSSYVSAADVDDRIESSAKASYNFKTYLKNDNIHIESKNGAVALTGTVSEESHKSLACFA